MKYSCAVLCSFLFACLSHAGDRDIQIRTVNFETSIVELHNFGTGTVSIGSFRFCTHDDDQAFQYSTGGGLAGNSIAPGESFYVHYLNDAPAVSNRINISTIGGGFATPLDTGPYGLALYWQAPPFGLGANMADYVQWNIDGAGDPTADARATEAVAGGMWTTTNRWVHTTASSRLIELSDNSSAELHDSMDYAAVDEDVLFWYRFNEGGGTNIYDSAARFQSSLPSISPTRTWQSAWSAPVYDGNHDIGNPHSFSGPLTLNKAKLTDPPTISSDWTAEVIHQFNPGGESTVFFEVTEGTGVSATNSAITFRWSAFLGTGRVDIIVRDQELQDSSETTIVITDFPADGKWHHVAAVKQGGSMYGYRDYVLVSSNSISFRGDGSYEFTTNHNISVGIAANNASASKDVNLFDETRLTMDALSPGQFLQPGQPQITNFFLSGSATANMSIMIVSGQTYRIDRSDDGPNGPWDEILNFTDFPAPSVNAIFGIFPPSTNLTLRVTRDLP